MCEGECEGRDFNPVKETIPMKSNNQYHHNSKYIPLRYYLTGYILLLILPILVTVSVIDYIDARGDLTESYKILREQSENEIVSSLRLVDSGYKMFEKTLDEQMRQAFIPFLKAYNDSGGDPAKIDLQAVKNDIGGTMDLYIINKKNVVEYSTYETDVGLEFSQWPDFMKTLATIREGVSYFPDRITPETRTGILRKYAYLPTPDHEYVLELGLVSAEFKFFITDLDYFKVGQDLKDLNPSLENIRIYDRTGNRSGAPNEKADPVTSDIIRRVYQARQNFEIRNKESQSITRYVFVDLYDPMYATDVSKIVELTYTLRPMAQRLKNKTIYHLSISLIAVLLCIVLSPLLAGQFTKPIGNIIKDAEKIAGGDLEHRIEVNSRTELKNLERSINRMVMSLEDNIEQLRKSEEKIRAYSQHLDELVKARTHELQDANEDLKAFAHSISHDLRAPLMSLKGYAESLKASCGEGIDEESSKYIDRLITTSKYIERIIQDLLSWNYLRRTDIKLENINLESIVDEVIRQLEHEINEKDATVTVVNPLPQVKGHESTLFTVITNLVTNALKYVREGVPPVIRIYGETRDGWVRFCVEDNGIGIPTEDQERIFGVFERLKQAKDFPGTGIGLAMVYKGIERMGGTVGVESEPDKGSTFWFELRRV